MQSVQQFCLRWNNHQPNFISVFTNLLNHEALVDVTIACDGRHLQAHRVVLSACSSYFQSLFTVNPCQHPIVILKDIKFNDLKTMVDFMYYGEVNVSQEQLPSILKIAEMLKIKGLAEIPDQKTMMKNNSTSSDKDVLLTPGESNWGSTERRSPSPMSPQMRRKRLRKSSTGSGSGSTEKTSEEVSEGLSANIKIERVETQASTDSEPKEGSQDSGAEDPPVRQMSHERQTYPDPRQLSCESRQGSFENRQGSIELRQVSHDHKPQLSTESRQASHESRLSHESSVESVNADAELAALSPAHGKIGTKRGRLLMRQSRIKKESDLHTSPDSEPSSPGFGNSKMLTVPTKIERQRSEPTPYTQGLPSSPPQLQPSPSLNLLTVPQPAFLIKQHSFPSNPTQPTKPFPPQNAILIHRQISQPAVTLVSTSPYQKPTNTEPETRAISPSVPSEQLPIVRIISDTELSHITNPKRQPLTPLVETVDAARSVHCPVLRQGPALGCNFCWNTIDAHGRILRRKTKYHCPECQTNLCIVPCFQEYHLRHKPPSSPPKTDT